MRENCCWNSNKRWHYTFHPSPSMRLNEVQNSQQRGCEMKCIEKCAFLFLQIKYSIMHPGTHVWPHTGPTNCRLRMHLGLVIPKEGCRIRCAQENRYGWGFFVVFGGRGIRLFAWLFCWGFFLHFPQNWRRVFYWPGCVIYFIKQAVCTLTHGTNL